MPAIRKKRLAALLCWLCCLPAALLLAGCMDGAGGESPALPASSQAPAAEPVGLARPEGGRLDLAYLTGQQNGAPAPARPGDEMAEEELLAAARELLQRGQALYNWAWSPESWAVDGAAPLAEEWYGKPCTLYPLLDFADEEQLRAVYASIFSEGSLRRQEERYQWLQENFPDAEFGRPPFCTREGRLYANPSADPGRNTRRCSPDTLRLVGASADAAVLEAEEIFEDGQPMGHAVSITLLREGGRWVLAGPLWDMPPDNRFVSLPEELAGLARRLDAEDPDAAFCLRQAARLGQALMAGNTAEVNRCFIDRGGGTPEYDMNEYAFTDLTGLRVSGWQVELEESAAEGGQQTPPKIWLRLRVDDPGATPLRTGDERYLAGFHSGGDSMFAKGCIASLQPESEVVAVDGTLLDEAGRQARLLRWIMGREDFDDFTKEEPLRLLAYCSVRLRWEGLADENGGFTEGQLAALQRELGLEQLGFGPDMMEADGFTFAGGRWYPPGREGYGGNGPERESRFAALHREGDTVTAVLRFYHDAQCLMPAYDLTYTFWVGPSGAWRPVRCEKQPAG